MDRVKVCFLVAVGYVAGSLTSYFLYGGSETGPIFFPPAGVTAAALILTHKRQWPYVLATVAMCELIVDLAQGIPILQTAGFVAANVLEPLVGVFLLRRLHLGPIDLTRRHDSAAFFASAVLVGPMVGGLVGASTIALSGSSTFAAGFFPFWAGDALGVLAVAGTILAWTSAPRSAHRRSWAEVVGALGGIGALTVVGFVPEVVPLSYLPLPLMFFCAFRYGIRVVMAGGLVMTLVANIMTGNGFGPWHALAEMPRFEVATLQLFLAVVIVAAWVLTIDVVERERQHSIAVAESRANRRLSALHSLSGRLAVARSTEEVAQIAIEHVEAHICDQAELTLLTKAGVEVWIRREGAFVQLAASPNKETSREEQSEATLPLQTPTEAIGKLVCVWWSRKELDEATWDELATTAQSVSQALVRARGDAAQRAIAYSLQQALLPLIPSVVGRVGTAGVYQPADSAFDVGGDWYDVFLMDGGRVAFAVGDVMGHDLNAAAVMGRLSTTLRLIAAGATDPAHVLEEMDKRVQEIDGAFLTTLGFGLYEPASHTVLLARAGHPPAILKDKTGAYLLEGHGGPPLGVSNGPRKSDAYSVTPDSMLLWYSDGLIERRGEDLTTGLARLLSHAQSMESHDPRAWCASITEQLIGETRLEDDSVVLALRLAPG